MGPALLVDRALADHGRVDVLVNNVGAVRLRLEGFLGTSDEEFEWAMQMNFFTALRATARRDPAMVEQGGGAIVNVASVNAFFQPDGGTIDYGAAKAALRQPQQVAGAGVRRPGHPRQLRLPGPGRAPTCGSASTGWPRRSPRRRASTPTRRARAVDRRASAASPPGASRRRRRSPTLVVMLASERTGNVTGANYVIDGGLIKTL